MVTGSSVDAACSVYVQPHCKGKGLLFINSLLCPKQLSVFALFLESKKVRETVLMRLYCFNLITQGGRRNKRQILPPPTQCGKSE